MAALVISLGIAPALLGFSVQTPAAPAEPQAAPASLAGDALRSYPLGALPAPGFLQDLRAAPAKRSQAEYLAAKHDVPLDRAKRIVDLAWHRAQPEEGIPPELILGVIEQESALDPRATSSAGAQGLMQVVARWHRARLAPEESLLNPKVNIRVGTEVLQSFLREKRGDLHKALERYSGGAPGYAQKVLGNAKRLAAVAAAEQALSGREG